MISLFLNLDKFYKSLHNLDDLLKIVGRKFGNIRVLDLDKFMRQARARPGQARVCKKGQHCLPESRHLQHNICLVSSTIRIKLVVWQIWPTDPDNILHIELHSILGFPKSHNCLELRSMKKVLYLNRVQDARLFPYLNKVQNRRLFPNLNSVKDARIFLLPQQSPRRAAFSLPQ